MHSFQAKFNYSTLLIAWTAINFYLIWYRLEIQLKSTGTRLFFCKEKKIGSLARLPAVTVTETFRGQNVNSGLWCNQNDPRSHRYTQQIKTLYAFQDNKGNANPASTVITLKKNNSIAALLKLQLYNLWNEQHS